MACQSSTANIFHFTEIRIYRTHWTPWPETRGGSRSSRTAGRAAMDATASGASGIAGRETVSNCLRANDTAPTASSHGRDGEHTPAVEDACEDVRGRRSRVVPTPGVCASSLAVMMRSDRTRTSAIREATGAIVHRSPRRARRTPLKPFAQGRPGDRHHLWSTPCALFVAHGPAGASRRPAFPAPLSR